MNAVIEAYYAQSRPEMVAFLPRQAYRVLEVGCGAGIFGRVLKEKYPGVCLFGIENNTQMAAEAAKTYDQVWVSDVCEAFDLAEEDFFDLVIFNDVLEHLNDPWKCLRLARNHITHEGTVVASIPNMRFWPIFSDLVFQRAWKYRDAGVMDRTHLRFFTEKSILSLFEDSGYRVRSIEGINETSKKSLRWRVLNVFSAGLFKDCIYPQFAVVAEVDSKTDLNEQPPK